VGTFSTTDISTNVRVSEQDSHHNVG
jgi:hypothetical protein